MDSKTNSGLNPQQQDTFNRIMSTPTSSQPTDQAAAPYNSLPDDKQNSSASNPSPLPNGDLAFSTFSKPQSSTSSVSQSIGTTIAAPPSAQTSPLSGTPPSPLNTPSQFSTAPKPNITYEVPTIGLQTPGVGGTIGGQSSVLKIEQTKVPAGIKIPAKSKGSALKLVIFVILGLILIAAYTVVWALIFGLTLPFSLPF
jgi:hypothetical protein